MIYIKAIVLDSNLLIHFQEIGAELNAIVDDVLTKGTTDHLKDPDETASNLPSKTPGKKPRKTPAKTPGNN